jgi:hypothetical protein
LDVIAIERRVNPREVKRFINSYTLQTLIRPDLKPEAVLALQTMAFRQDWYHVYNALITHPNRFRDALRDHRDGRAELRELFPDLPEFPEELNTFLLSDLIKPLADEPDFDTYTSSLDAAEVPRTLRAPELSQSPADEEVRALMEQIATLQARVRPATPATADEQVRALEDQLASLQARWPRPRPSSSAVLPDR